MNSIAALQSVIEADSILVGIFSGNSNWHWDPPQIPIELYRAYPDIYQGPPRIPLEPFQSNFNMYQGPPPLPFKLFDGYFNIYQGLPPITTLSEGGSFSFYITLASTTTINDRLNYYTIAPHIPYIRHCSLQDPLYSNILNIVSFICQSNTITATTAAARQQLFWPI